MGLTLRSLPRHWEGGDPERERESARDRCSEFQKLLPTGMFAARTKESPLETEAAC